MCLVQDLTPTEMYRWVGRAISCKGEPTSATGAAPVASAAVAAVTAAAMDETTTAAVIPKNGSLGEFWAILKKWSIWGNFDFSRATLPALPRKARSGSFLHFQFNFLWHGSSSASQFCSHVSSANVLKLYVLRRHQLLISSSVKW